MPVNAALLEDVTAAEPQASLNTALLLTATVRRVEHVIVTLWGLTDSSAASDPGSALVYLVKIFLKKADMIPCLVKQFPGASRRNKRAEFT